MTVQIRTLGNLTVAIDGAVVDRLKNRKALALLAYLATQPGRQFTREHLQTLLWSNSSAIKGRNSLRQTLYQLQRTLPDDLLLLEFPHVGFNAACDYWLDVEHAAADPALYQGEFLQGFTLRGAEVWDDWLAEKREQIISTLIVAWEKSAETHPDPAPLLLRVITLNPLREQPYRRLMTHYLQRNDRPSAAALYETLASLLEAEIGVTPSAETQALYQRVLVDTPQHNLPHPNTLTPFVGRAQQLAQLTAWLRTPAPRLITLLGLGGVGKTRLAIASAHAAQDYFLDGVCFVDLTDADQLALPIAAALGLKLSGRDAPDKQLLVHLRDRQLLLVLDNFETLVDTPGAVAWINRLLLTAPAIKLLVTSRQRLRLRLEQVYRVDGLAIEEEAVVLFRQVAQQVGFGFSAEIAPITRVCQLVEGMPLAIEMAAALTPDLTCAAIADEIERDLAILRSSYADMPAQHASLHVVFRQTWRRLTAEQQTVLRGLTLMRAGFGTAAAEAVASASPLLLRQLSDCALVQAMGDERYRIHALLRQFVRDDWGDAEEIGRIEHKLATHYLGWAAAQQDTITGGEQISVFNAYAQRLDNITLAWEIAIRQKLLDLLAPTISSLSYYLAAQGMYTVERDLSVAALELTAGLHTEQALRLRQRLLIAAAFSTFRLGDIEQSHRYGEESVHIAARLEDATLYALSLAHYGYQLSETGQLEKAVALLEEAAQLYLADIDHPPNELQTFNTLGIIYKRQGNMDKARQHYLHCLDLAQRHQNHRAHAYVLNNLGVLEQEAGGEESAIRNYYEQALGLFKQINDVRMIGMVSNNLGNIDLDRQRWAAARQFYQSGLAAIEQSGERWVRALLLLNLGSCHLGAGDWTQAEAALNESDATFAAIYDNGLLAQVRCRLAHLATMRQDSVPVDERIARVRAHLRSALTLAHDESPTLLEAVGEWGLALARLFGERRLSAEYLTFVAQHPQTHADVRVQALRHCPIASCPPRIGTLATIVAEIERALSDRA